MNRNRSGFAVMAGLIGMIKANAWHHAFSGAHGLHWQSHGNIYYGTWRLWSFNRDRILWKKLSLALIITLMAVFAILRGILRYAEQACNHFIAFKLLARIRHQVFAALRKLAPAKLDGSEKGNLISIITSDIELLEVFYAHTISPIAIAVITSVVMCVYLGSMSAWFAVIAACFYVLVGVVIPLWNGKEEAPMEKIYRDSLEN